MAQEIKPGNNGFDPDKVKAFVSRIEALHAEIESEKGQYMVRCKVLREDIKDVLNEAKDAGFPKGELRDVIKTRQMQKKLDAIREDMEPSAQDIYDMLRHALGDLADLPLGEAALREPDPGNVAQLKISKPRILVLFLLKGLAVPRQSFYAPVFIADSGNIRTL